MLKRWLIFWRWLRTGAREEFMPTPPVVVQVPTPITLTPQVTVDRIYVEDNIILWAASAVVAGQISRGAVPNFDYAISQALSLKTALEKFTGGTTQ